MLTTPHTDAPGGYTPDSLSEAESGMFNRRPSLIALPGFVYTRASSKDLSPASPLSPVSPVHHGLTPCTSVPNLALPSPAKESLPAKEVFERIETVRPAVRKPVSAKRKVSRRIQAELWFNVYRRFFTFVVLLNLTGIILASIGRFSYAEGHLGALVLGNLLCAILMRNELFVRFLYLVFIYGLRRVCIIVRSRRYVADE